MHSSIFVAILAMLRLCFGKYTLEVLLESYKNPTHRLADGSCCDYFYKYDCHKSVCKNFFVICVRPYGHLSKDDHLQCPNSTDTYETFVIRDDDITFADKQVLNTIKHVSNPLKFTGEVWPGQVQVYVQVYNWDAFGEQLVDDVIQVWSVPVGNGSYSRAQTFRGQKGHVTLTTRIRVMCSDNYDGPYCSHYCGISSCQHPDGKDGAAALPLGTSTTTPPNTTTTKQFTEFGVLDHNKNLEQFEAVTSQASYGSGLSRRRVGAIVGGVLVGIFFLVLLAILVIVCCLWCRKRQSAEGQAIRGTNDTRYRSISHSAAAGHSGAYTRKINNNIYSSVPSHGRVERDNMDFIISEATTDRSRSSNPLSVTDSLGPVSSQYSVIKRRDSDVSTVHSEEELLDNDQRLAPGQIESGYSVITRDNMDYVSEASDSDEGHASDTELVKESMIQKETETASLRGEEEQNQAVLYENIP